MTDVELGRHVDAEGKVTDGTDEFRPGDTVYVSVATEGSAANAELVARWAFEDGQIVDETSRTIVPQGSTRTEFHISKPGGFPKGKYKVEVRLNGTTTETEEFEVK